MQNVKTTRAAEFVPAADWVRRLAEETSAFEVQSVRAGRPGKERARWDTIVTLSVPPHGRRVELYIRTKANLSPQAALAILRCERRLPRQGAMLVCAPYISARVAELCRAEGVGYLDAVGNCRLEAPGLLIHVSGRPNRPAPVKAADPFSRKSSRLIRVLLTHPDRGWQVQQLAEAAGVSLGLASRVKQTLLEQAYLEERGRLLYPRDAAHLLECWAAHYRPRVKKLPVFALNRAAETEEQMAHWCRRNGIAYALTQLTAAWRYAPTVRNDRSVVYVEGEVVAAGQLRALLDCIEAKEVESGANCTLWLTDDPVVFTDTRERDGLKLVSPLQLYLDLRALAGRGEEAAQEILRAELPWLLPGSRQGRQGAKGGGE